MTLKKQPFAGGKPRKRGCLLTVLWVLAGLLAVFVALIVVVAATATDEDRARWAEEEKQRKAEREAQKVRVSAEKAAAKATRKQEEEKQAQKEAQFKCASPWDGSIRSIENAMEVKLRDPDSFQHIETSIGPVQENGTQLFVMKYRARNGFGGLNMETAVGALRNSDCEILELAVQG